MVERIDVVVGRKARQPPRYMYPLCSVLTTKCSVPFGQALVGDMTYLHGENILEMFSMFSSLSHVILSSS